VLPGDCAGELSLIDGFQVSADVYAEEDCELLVIDREHVWHFMEQTPLVARNLLRLLAGRVRNDDRMLEESERLKREYEDAATVDVLTGLRNRRWLNDAFTRQLERSARSRHAVSLLMIDVDRFKDVNDRHGHLVGDEVLVQLGRTVAGALRPQDLLARFGGEEFVVLLPDLPHVEVSAVAERLREAVGSTPVLTSVGLLGGLSVSIGVATQTAGPSTSLSTLFDAADRALYEAKAAGRNCVRG
jgi:diguanylate cyclase (GGDEF)-like protein